MTPADTIGCALYVVEGGWSWLAFAAGLGSVLALQMVLIIALWVSGGGDPLALVVLRDNRRTGETAGDSGGRDL